MHRHTIRLTLIVSLVPVACFDPTKPGVGDDGVDTVTGSATDGSGGADDLTASAGTQGDPTPATGDPSGDPSVDPTGNTATTDATGGVDTTGATDTSDPTSAESSTDPTASSSTGNMQCEPACGALVCGDDPVCGESCGACDAGETCNDQGAYCGLELGWPDDFGFTGDVNADVLFGHRVTLPAAATLRRFGVIAGGNGTVRMGLYTQANGPDDLVAQSGEFDVIAGSNESSIDGVALVAGDYWIGVIAGASVPLRVTAPGDDSHEQFYALHSYDDALPPTLTTETVVNDYRYNLYVVVDDG
jgi:hypothetical protein